VLVTWDSVALIHARRIEGGLDAYRTHMCTLAFENDQPSYGLRLLAQLLAAPPSLSHVRMPRFVSLESVELAQESFFLRAQSSHSDVYDALDSPAVAKMCRGESQRVLFEAERDALSALRGVANIVELLGTDEGACALLIAPQCAGHVTFERLNKTFLTSGRLEHLAHQAVALVSALHAVHDRGFLHRDLCPANILVAKNNALLLADFGLACRGIPTVSKHFVGRYAYAADSLLHTEEDLFVYSRATDLESLVKTLFVSFYGGSFEAAIKTAAEQPSKEVRLDALLAQWAFKAAGIPGFGSALALARAENYAGLLNPDLYRV